VQAPDADTAIKRYLAEHDVAEWERRRLFAIRNG